MHTDATMSYTDLPVPAFNLVVSLFSGALHVAASWITMLTDALVTTIPCFTLRRALATGLLPAFTCVNAHTSKGTMHPTRVKRQPAHLTSLPDCSQSRTFWQMTSSSFCSLLRPRFSRALTPSRCFCTRSMSFKRSSLQHADAIQDIDHARQGP